MSNSHILRFATLAALSAAVQFSAAQDPSGTEGSSGTESAARPETEAPINETANEVEQSAQAAEAAPVLNATDEGDGAESVEGVIRDQSYENSTVDQQVANALSEQGYYSGDNSDSKEAFTQALKNFQTLNGLPVTGVITPEVLSRLGILMDEFSPQ